MSDIITIQVTSTPIQAALDELNRRCQHLQPAFDAIGQVIRTNVIDCFQNETSPDGIHWKALEPATIKKRRNGSNKILQDTGKLLGSIAYSATNSHAEVTTDTEYAPHHQFGTSKMVARPFFPSQTLPQDWENDVMDVLNSYLIP